MEKKMFNGVKDLKKNEEIYTYEDAWGLWYTDKNGEIGGVLDCDYMGEDAYMSEYYEKMKRSGYTILKSFETKEDLEKYLGKKIDD